MYFVALFSLFAPPIARRGVTPLDVAVQFVALGLDSGLLGNQLSLHRVVRGSKIGLKRRDLGLSPRPPRLAAGPQPVTKDLLAVVVYVQLAGVEVCVYPADSQVVAAALAAVPVGEERIFVRDVTPEGVRDHPLRCRNCRGDGLIGKRPEIVAVGNAFYVAANHKLDRA